MSDDLMHAGVKGMKWGRRKAVSTVSKSPQSSQKNELLKRRAKIAGGVALGAAVAIGSIALMSTLNKKGGMTVSSVASSPSTSAGRDFLDLSFGATSRATPSSGGPSLNLGNPSRSSSPSGYPSTGGSRGPSVSALNDILKNTPNIRFDSSTGQYRSD